MKSLKYSHFIVLCAFIALFSCKKREKPEIDKPVPPQPIEKPAENPEEQPVEVGIYIPIKFEGAGLNLSLKYKKNTAVLTEITDGNENKTIITYTTEQLPQKLEKYKKGLLFYVVYYEQLDKKTTNKVITFNYTIKPETYIPTGFYTLSYNDDNKISSVNYYNTSDQLIKTSILLYNESLNLSEIHATHLFNSSAITTYSFDQKKGISSFLPYSELFALEFDHWFFLCTGNNLLTILSQKSPEDKISFNYEYNENGYPSNMMVTNNNNQTIKITYKRLEQ